MKLPKAHAATSRHDIKCMMSSSIPCMQVTQGRMRLASQYLGSLRFQAQAKYDSSTLALMHTMFLANT